MEKCHHAARVSCTSLRCFAVPFPQAGRVASIIAHLGQIDHDLYNDVDHVVPHLPL